MLGLCFLALELLHIRRDLFREYFAFLRRDESAIDRRSQIEELVPNHGCRNGLDLDCLNQQHVNLRELFCNLCDVIFHLATELLDGTGGIFQKRRL